MAALKAKALEAVKDDDKSRRLTGKAWFLREAASGAAALGEVDVLSSEDEDFEMAEEDFKVAAAEMPRPDHRPCLCLCWVGLGWARVGQGRAGQGFAFVCRR